MDVTTKLLMTQRKLYHIIAALTHKKVLFQDVVDITASLESVFMAAKFKNKFLTINRKKIEIVRFLGSGSLGGVWEIKNELGYPKALKVLYKLREVNTEKFLEKLAILKKISHPNILKMETTGIISRYNLQSLLDEEQIEQNSVEEVPYFTMPYAAINLADYIVTQKENLLERVKLSLHLCSAVRKIHQLKIYNEKMQVESLEHGNLKFSNLLLIAKNNTFSLKVGDLGIEPSLGVDRHHTSQTAMEKQDDFATTQKTLNELLSSLHEQLKSLPSICDQKALDIWTDKLREIEQHMRREKSARSFLHLGIKLYGNSAYQYALKDFDKALSLDNNLYEAHLYKGLTLQEMDKSEEAEKCYHQAISVNDLDPRAHENLGEIYSQRREFDKAIAFFEKAIHLDRDMPFCYASLGSIYKEKELYDKAITVFSKLIALEEDCVPAYIDRGDVYFAVCEYENAQKDYQKAFDLENDNEEIKAKLALANEKLKG
ncbi:GlcNAc transferase [Candidatus Uabimicrobium amorphum]|uniref:GlcNAc transferase n=2 Tax=Uabimicrobium amorphum TaxID=2596890 RepID=A0A5S9IIE4_UABAM|nr:GlcNAc transferase [Candidatus Uabimicrobium amorphum]